MFSGLRSRLIVSYALIIMVSLMLAGGVLAVSLYPLQTRLTLNRLADRAIPTAFHVREMMNQGLTPEEAIARLKEQAQEQSIRILLLTREGNILADTDEQLQGAWIKALPPEGGRPYMWGRISLPEGKALFYVALPLPMSHMGMMGVRRSSLFLALATSQRGELLREMLPALLIAGAAAFLISVFLALLIARSIAAPLRRIAMAAEEIARGNYDQELAISSPDEVRSLADSFNAMARQVKAARQAQRDFLANVSHDLKTPLTSIQGFSQALLDGAAGDEEVRRRAAQIVHDEAGRMARLVEDLLDLARIDAGQVTLAREPVDLGELMHVCLEKFAPQAKEKGVKLEMELPPLPRIIGDGDLLAQVFTNLIDNALKNTPSGGRVLISAESLSSDGFVRVHVSDTGTGIPPEDLPRIFERFYQVDKSRAGTRRGEGAGLGLAIAKEIVQAHGGQIKAESVLGLGTRFTVSLPLGNGE